MRHETLWEVTFRSKEGDRTLNVACSEGQLIDTLKESMWWGSRKHELVKIEKIGTVRIAPSVESQPKAAPCPEPTCITWTASWST